MLTDFCMSILGVCMSTIFIMKVVTRKFVCTTTYRYLNINESRSQCAWYARVCVSLRVRCVVFEVHKTKRVSFRSVDVCDGSKG